MTAENLADDVLLEVRNLGISYQTRSRRRIPATRSVSFRLRRGETLAVVGESGSGKSTLVNALLGLLPANATLESGHILIEDEEVTTASDRQWCRLRGSVVGFIPQDPALGLDPTLTVGAQLNEAVRLHGTRDSPRVAEASLALMRSAAIDNPELRIRQYPHQLSGGLRQRVLIALALAGGPRLILADEPTSALDVTVQKRILDHLDTLVRDGEFTLLLVTHDLGVAAERASRILVMQDGRVVEEGPSDQILSAPREAYTRQLISSVPRLAIADRVRPRDAASRKAEPVGSPLLRFDNVSKVFRTSGTGWTAGLRDKFRRTTPGHSQNVIHALDDVSLRVDAGRTFGLVGESGSGKSTTLRIAAGLERADSGSVTFAGTDITSLPEKHLRPLRTRFQLVQQNPHSAMDPKFTIMESICEPLVCHDVGDRRTQRAIVLEFLDRVALPTSVLDRHPHELSGGQLQRAAIARALVLKPDLVCLGEPVSALDVSVQAQILDLLRELQDDLGVAYLFVSHDLAVVAQLAHEVAVMSKGVLVESGSLAEVFDDPRTPYTKELLAAAPPDLPALGLAAGR